jgi:geranylgeranyl pyrophosphate synthase
MLEAIKEGAPHSEGEFYERVLQLGVDLHNKTEEEAFDGSIFDDRVDASDGFGMDYVLRGGKRLRPAMTLFTEYALEGEISHKGMLVGAAQEIIHASSLAQDDEMDGDPIRRLKLTTERVNHALFNGEGYDQSMLDGNKVEAWGNKAVLAAVGQGVPQESAQEALTIEADLQDGQKRDIDMEDRELREADLEDYEQMIDGKTGALYSGGVEIIVEDHLEDVDYSEVEGSSIGNGTVQDLFMRYMDQFNKLFQAGDDAIEVFRPDGSGKSVTDIVNRKITFPAINTKYGLREEDESYAELFLDVFDDAYEQVTEGMRETAADMGIEIPDYAEVGGAWEEEWITETIQEYGLEPSQDKADEYLSNAEDAMERLQENSVIDEDVKQKYQEMAEFVWTRDY